MKRKIRNTGNCSRTRCSAFTIVEVIVALSVTGVGILAIFGALTAANEAVDRIRNEENAQRIAEARITSLLGNPIERLGTQKGEEGKYKWVESIIGSQDPNIFEVSVKVKWSHRGRPFEFELVSLKKAG